MTSDPVHVISALAGGRLQVDAGYVKPPLGRVWFKKFLNLIHVQGVCRMAVTKQEALDYHEGSRPGKVEVVSTKPCRTQRDLSPR